MCDAASQRADGLHFLRLSQLRFQLFFVGLCQLLGGPVPRRTYEPARLARRVAQTAAARLQPVPVAVGLADSIFALIAGRKPLEVIFECSFESRPVVGMNDDLRQPGAARIDLRLGTVT